MIEKVTRLGNDVGDNIYIEPEAVLDGAKEDNPVDVVVVTVNEDGKLTIACSSGAERAHYLMALAQHWLVSRGLD